MNLSSSQLAFTTSFPIVSSFISSKYKSTFVHHKSFSTYQLLTNKKWQCAIAANTFSTNPDPFSNHSVSISSLSTSSFRLTIIGGGTEYISLANDIIKDVGGEISDWRSLAPNVFDTKVYLPFHVNIDSLRSHLRKIGDDIVDLIIQPQSIAEANKKLAVFDLDSTLIMQETIDELAAELNVQKQVKIITERAMNGEIGFRDALRERVNLLKGLPLHALDGVKTRVEFTKGAKQLIHILSKLGCRTAVVSGGFHFLADHVKDELGLDFSFANRLQVDENGVLTGKTVGDIVDSEYKKNTLIMLAKQFDLQKEQILAVGDGSNDLLMMHQAGLGVAFNAKPYVRNRAKYWVNQPSLMNVLYLLGYSNSQIDSIVKDTGKVDSPVP